MASEQVTLVANKAAYVPLDAPTTRVVATMLSGPATVYATADGNDPVVPSSGVEVPGSQIVLAGVLGQQIVLSPPLFGDHMAIPTIKLISAGTPVVSLGW